MKINIVIVEDDLVIAHNLKEQLIELGYEDIYICPDEASFRERTSRVIPDLLFVDINLGVGEKTGIDIVGESGVYSEAAVIILSSYDDKEYRERAKHIIADAYLIKPVDQKQIDVTIDIALHNKHRIIKASKGGDGTLSTLLPERDYFFVKKGDQYEKVLYGDICYARASGSYVDLFTIQRKKYTLSFTLKYLLERLSEKDLVRCHRGYAVNPSCIQAFDEGSVFVAAGKEVVKISIGSNYKADIAQFLPRL